MMGVEWTECWNREEKGETQHGDSDQDQGSLSRLCTTTPGELVTMPMPHHALRCIQLMRRAVCANIMEQ